MRCGGGGEDVLCYGANKARGDAPRSLQYVKGVKITTTWSEHDERYRVISLQTLDLGNKDNRN